MGVHPHEGRLQTAAVVAGAHRLAALGQDLGQGLVGHHRRLPVAVSGPRSMGVSDADHPLAAAVVSADHFGAAAALRPIQNGFTYRAPPPCRSRGGAGVQYLVALQLISVAVAKESCS